MSKHAQWAVVPDIRPHNGDMRRDFTPYVLTGGISWTCLSIAQYAARDIRARGNACYVEMVGA